MDEFLEQFLVESRELVEQASADLLALEESPADRERLEDAFRAFHTLKGSAAIVDFTAMASTTHAIEDIFAKVRKGEVAVSRGLISSSLSYLNILTQWLDTIAATGELPSDAASESASFLAGLPDHARPSDDGAQTIQGLSDSARQLLEAQIVLLRQDGGPGHILSAGHVAANVLTTIGRSEIASEFHRLADEAVASGNADPLVQLLLKQIAAEPAAVVAGAEAAPRVLRVDVGRIDDIVRLTGELTVAKNALGHTARLAREGAGSAAVAEMLRRQHGVIDRLTSELQHAVLSIRVLPLRFVFQRFPRLVRETAEALGKPVKLDISGEDTEADKVIVESLFEPLLHILRNALDHGIETASQRKEAGKSPVATLRMQAERHGDRVIVKVSDDGRGVNVAEIRRVASERNILPSDELEQLADGQVVDLIFAPGFSTATTVTDLSGRGVGMNAVRSAIDRLGGEVKVTSAPGQGTTVALTLPFSVLMTRVMTVVVGGQTFGIPFEDVIETARVPREQIVPVGKARAVALRGRSFPVMDLGAALGPEFTTEPGREAKLVLVTVAGQMGCVEVDSLGDRMEVMLRAPEGLLARLPGIAGTSLLGDGSVLIVVDLQELLA